MKTSLKLGLIDVISQLMYPGRTARLFSHASWFLSLNPNTSHIDAVGRDGRHSKAFRVKSKIYIFKYESPELLAPPFSAEGSESITRMNIVNCQKVSSETRLTRQTCCCIVTCPEARNNKSVFFEAFKTWFRG